MDSSPQFRLKPLPHSLASRPRLLSRLPLRARLAAVEAVLEAGSDAELEVFAPELLELLARTRFRPATQATARLYCRLPPQARSAALCMAGERLVAAASSLDASDPLVRRSVAALAASMSAPALAARLPAMLLDPDPRVVSAADQAISELAVACANASWSDREAAARAVMEAIATFDQHRCKGVLLAGLRLLGTPASLATASSAGDWLTDQSHPAQMAIRSLLRRSDEPDIARAAMVWLRVPAQASACRERVLGSTNVGDIDAFLRLGHLLAHPARARSLAAAPATRTAKPGPPPALDPDVLAQLPLESRRFAPRWLAQLPAAESAPDAASATLALDPSPLVKLALLAGPGAACDTGTLLDLAFDADPCVARGATLRLIRIRETTRGPVQRAPAPAPDPITAALARLARSPHAGVRAMVHAGTRAGSAPTARAGRRLALRYTPGEALAQLRDRLIMGARDARLACLLEIRRLRVAAPMERDLCDLAQEIMDPGTPRHDPILAATLVAALGECTGERSRALLEGALGDADARIQANAVEALARRARRHDSGSGASALADRLIEFKGIAAHRLRANSALALLQVQADSASADTARREIRRMLADERPPHRLAGMWLAERAAGAELLNPADLLHPVGGLRRDATDSVRARAELCFRRLWIIAGSRGRADATDAADAAPAERKGSAA